MAMLPSTALNLVRRGSNLRIEEESYPANTLEDLLRAARYSGAQVTIRTKGLSPSALEKLAKFGGNNVTFVM